MASVESAESNSSWGGGELQYGGLNLPEPPIYPKAYGGAGSENCFFLGGVPIVRTIIYSGLYWGPPPIHSQAG